MTMTVAERLNRVLVKRPESLSWPVEIVVQAFQNIANEIIEIYERNTDEDGWDLGIMEEIWTLLVDYGFVKGGDDD